MAQILDFHADMEMIKKSSSFIKVILLLLSAISGYNIRFHL